MHPLSPRVLPREVVAEDVGVTKKKGRPSRRERIKRARDSLVALDGWCAEVSGSAPSGTRYMMEKTTLVDAIGGDERWEGALGEANAVVAERMEMIGELIG